MFNPKMILEPHFKTVRIEKKFHFCPFCKIQFPSEQAVSEHWKSCDEYKYKCEKCGINLSSKGSVTIHKSRCRIIQSPLKFGGFGCGKCDKKHFSSKKSCLEHVKICKKSKIAPVNSELSCLIGRISVPTKQLISEHFLKNAHPVESVFCPQCGQKTDSTG